MVPDVSVPQSESNLLKLIDAVEALCLKKSGAKLDFNKLKEVLLSLIVHGNKNHRVVVYRIKSRVYLSDPAYGLLSLSQGFVYCKMDLKWTEGGSK